MNQLEDRLTTLLQRSADAVEVHPEAPMALISEGARRTGPRRRRTVVVLAAAVALVAVVGLSLLAWQDRNELHTINGPSPTVPAPAAANAPRVVVTAPGWTITSIQETTSTYGEMTFQNQDRTSALSLNWYPVKQYDELHNDRQHDSHGSDATVLGKQATLFLYRDTSIQSQRMMWVDGPVFFELASGQVATAEEFLNLVATLHYSDEPTFLAALPPEALDPGEAQATLQEILTHIPTPPGFAITSIDLGRMTMLYSLDYPIVHDVTCAWVQRWVDGTAQGDAARVDAAVAAMGTWRTWPLTLGSDYLAPTVGKLADSMARGVPAGSGTITDLGLSYLTWGECEGGVSPSPLS
jgi:hypothetical protein